MIAESRIKLFLVDDDAVFLKLMEIELLQNLEFDVETYSSGELCMASIAHNPDIIILDYNLDGMDKNAMNGIETLNKIKAYNRDIQVVMLSSQNRKLVEGVLVLLLGVYTILIGYRVLGKKPGEEMKYDEWYRRFGKIFKIGGPLIILFQVIRIIFILMSS